MTKVHMPQIPYGWRTLLSEMEVGNIITLPNIDNVVANGRSAIKVFRKKNPTAKFTTETNRKQHTFSIARTE